METKLHVKYHVIPALILFLALVILDISIFKEIQHRNQQWILAIVGIAWIVIFYILSPFKKLQLEQIKRSSTGKLSFDEEKLLIVIDEKNIRIDKETKSSVKLNIESTFNQRNQPIFFSRGRKYGTNNSLSSKEMNLNVKIFLEDEKDKKAFYEISKWALNNLENYEETTNRQRTYGGKKLSYNEIQTLEKSKH